MYSRIPTDTPKTDPFTGLYLGTFGPHGPEVLQLQRSVTEVITCIKYKLASCQGCPTKKTTTLLFRESRKEEVGNAVV